MTCGLIADLLVCLRAKHTKQMTSTDILDISECLEDAPSRWLLMMLPQDTSCLLCLFLCWHHTTIRLLDYHGDSSLTQFGRFATRSWVARPKLTYLPLSPQPAVSAEEDAAGDQARPRPDPPSPALAHTCLSVGVQPREMKINWLWTSTEAEEQRG